MINRIFIIFLLLFISKAYAVDPNRLAIVSGYGNLLCSTMTEDAKDSHAEGYYKEYIDGVSSGVNMAVYGKSYYLNGLDEMAKYKFVLKYCEDNPIDNVITGISKLYEKVNGVGIPLLGDHIPSSVPIIHRKK
jgi:hypothetical protein